LVKTLYIVTIYRILHNLKSKALHSFFLFVVLLLVAANTVFSQINFIENKGQWENNIKYRAEIPGGLLFIENGQLSYLFVDQEPFKELHDKGVYNKPVQMHYFRVVFEGANLTPTYKNELTAKTYYNFYLGNDPKKWATGVNAHGKIIVKNLYPGIDLEIFGSSNNSLKYNLIIQPNANPDVIKMRYEGLDDMRLKKGQLHLKTSLGSIKELAPVCYQYGDTALKYVKTIYSLKDNLLTFDIKEKYNRRKSFIIDPELIFSTYSGAFGDNWGYTGTWDNDGNAYSGGASYYYLNQSQTQVVSNGSFPTTPGAFQTTFKNGVSGVGSDLARDAAIYKVSSDGKTLIYATYLGGNHNEEPHSMIVNSKNQLVVFGTTFSTNFPVSANGYDRLLNGQADIFVFVLSADGKAMIGSTFIGGSGIDGLNGSASPGSTPLAYNYGDQYRGEVIVDDNDNIYVAASTQSTVGFPIKNAFQTSYGGTQDGCVFKLNPTVSNLEWSSYVGGVGYDICNGIDLDSKGNVLVAGGTTLGIDGITTGMGETTTFVGGSSDGFLLKLPPQGNVITNATYLGTNLYDQAYFVKVDNYDNPYVTGQTKGAWPVTTPIFHQPNGGQFITQFTPNLQSRIRSMTYGNGTVKPQISLSAFLVDECNRVFVSGWGGETNAAPGGHGGSTTQMSITNDAFQKNTDGSDFYLAVFSQNIDTLLYATFYGGVRFPTPQGERVDGGTSRFDRRGIIYQSVCAGCGGNSLFPATAGAHSTTNKSGNCNNAIFKIDFENLNHSPVVNDIFRSIDVGEELNFGYFGTDIDKYDTLFMKVDESAFTSPIYQGNMPTINYQKQGLRQLNLNFSWTPDCNQVTGDTIFMKVDIKDLGCPDNKQDSATIKILVTLPPVIPPPDVLCVVPTSISSLTLRWTNVDTSSKYFSHFMIKKIDPQGNEFDFGPFTKADKFEYVDLAVSDYRNRNYCYYIYAVNICGKKGANSYTVCTIDQFNAPINTTQIVTATVEDNKRVKLVWFDSKEDDFESYLVYRSPRTTNPKDLSYIFYGTTNQSIDTTFIDEEVDVNNQSFCYRIQVTDQCGHISKFSNIGCNIVLSGATEPYLHRLNWQNYLTWDDGVTHYELIRWDDRKIPASVYKGAPTVLNYNDEQLDYNWGAYWYKVIATENNGNLATSQSNEVRLIQKPLLHIPTAFTPTGDNLNDVWGLSDVFVKDYHMQVYNRWGEKVFESFDKNEQWSGVFERKEGPADDVFIWLVRYTGWDNSITVKKGTVTILN